MSDAEVCLSILRAGSKSFHAASLLLPRRMRAPAAAVYSFCRVADDLVDEGGGDEETIAALHARLDRIHRGAPSDDPVDRALAEVMREHRLPIAAFRALIEGFQWDVAGRRYETLADLRGYCVRVAATVGVIMTVLMGERRERVLARAADLGVAMQLTNIARDIGHDAREGRVYLPRQWLREVGLSADELVAAPVFRPELGYLTKRLLDEAERLYERAEHGIRYLPWDCRLAIAAARHLYADIGTSIVRAGYDSVSTRAFTTGPRKMYLVARSSTRDWRARTAPSAEPALPEAQDLVASAHCGQSRTDLGMQTS